MTSRKLPLILSIGLLLATLLLAERVAYPEIISSTLKSESGEEVSTKFPLRFGAHIKNSTLEVTFEQKSYHASTWFIAPDDCLKSVYMNDVLVEGFEKTRCVWPNTVEVDFLKYLKNGQNTARIEILNVGGGGGVALEPSRAQGVTPIVAGLVVILSSVVSFLLFGRSEKAILVVFILGAFLRYFYFLQTPIGVRSNDYFGHIDYIAFMGQHLSFPDARECWECYGPPLYYGFFGLLRRIGEYASRSNIFPFLNVHLGSLVFSILSLKVLINMGEVLFREKSPQKVFYALFIGTFPSFIIFAPRVNNDVFVFFFSLLFFYFFMQWWANGKEKTLLFSSASLGAAIASKSTALAFAPVLFLLLFIKKRNFPRNFLVSLFVLFVCSGVLLISRSALSDSQLFNHSNPVNSALDVPNNIKAFTTFAPMELLKKVYNHPYRDEFRRQYFFEYLFKSAYFGEFIFPVEKGMLTSIMLVSGMLASLLSIFGFFRSLCSMDSKHVPLVILAGSLLASIIGFRIMMPVSPAQDFRYVPLLAVLMGYYFATTIDTQSRLLKGVSVTVLAVSSISIVVFYLSVRGVS